MLSGYTTHPVEAMGGEHVRGDATYLGEIHTAEIRGGVVLADFGTMDRTGDAEVRKLQEQEAELCLEGTELEGCREKKKQAWNLLGEESNHGSIPGSFIAAPTAGNGIAAARMRDFKMDSGVGDPTEKGLKSLNYAAAKVVAHLQQEACEEGLIAQLFDELSVKPEVFKSGKWSKERFLDGLRKAGVSTTDTLPKRSFNVKPNEVLWKRKPRGIISAGDEGVILHIFDSAIFEHLLFSNPTFEARSIKHADIREYAARVGDFVRSYEFNASTDFGAFDGSCTTKVRDSIENMILKRLFGNVLGDGDVMTGILREAMRCVTGPSGIAL